VRAGYLETWAPGPSRWERNYFVLAGAELEVYVPARDAEDAGGGEWGTTLVGEEDALGGGEAGQVQRGMALAAVIDLHQGEWVVLEEDAEAREAMRASPRDKVKLMFCVGCDLRSARGLRYAKVTFRAEDKKKMGGWMDDIQQAVYEANLPKTPSASSGGADGESAGGRAGGEQAKRKGFLKKKGENFRIYSKRYFVLGPGPTMVYYYRQEDVGGLQPAGRADLTGATLHPRKDNKTLFSVVPAKRATVWNLQAASPEEAGEWMADILQASGRAAPGPANPPPNAPPPPQGDEPVHDEQQEQQEQEAGEAGEAVSEVMDEMVDAAVRDAAEDPAHAPGPAVSVDALHARLHELERTVLQQQEITARNTALIQELLAKQGSD